MCLSTISRWTDGQTRQFYPFWHPSWPKRTREELSGRSRLEQQHHGRTPSGPTSRHSDRQSANRTPASDRGFSSGPEGLQQIQHTKSANPAHQIQYSNSDGLFPSTVLFCIVSHHLLLLLLLCSKLVFRLTSSKLWPHRHSFHFLLNYLGPVPALLETPEFGSRCRSSLCCVAACSHLISFTMAANEAKHS